MPVGHKINLQVNFIRVLHAVIALRPDRPRC